MKKSLPSTHSLTHKLLRGTLAVAQVFSALSATIIGIAQPALPDAIASLQPLIGLPERALANYGTGAGATFIKGTVFQDYNSNGVMNTTGISPNLSIDWGVGNVTVSGMCVTSRGADLVLGTADDVYASSTAVQTTASSYVTTTVATVGGQYTLTVPALTITPSPAETTAGQTACRVSFSNFPSGYFPAPVGASGNVITPDNRSDVQFVNADATNVSFGLSVPEDYSQNNPPVQFLRQEGGDSTGSNANVRTLVAITSTPPSTTTAIPTGGIVFSQTGAVWGLAYQRQTKLTFAAAMLKRHVGAPNGLDAVYVADSSNPLAPSLLGRFNLNGIAPINGGAVISLGAVCRAAACGTPASDYTLQADPTLPSIDFDAFAKSGRTGIGDIDIDPSTNRLWLVNTNQQALISLDASGGFGTLLRDVRQYPITTTTNIPTCTQGNLRPWALKFNQGRGYLGLVCDAATTQSTANLIAYVVSFDPANPTSVTVEVTLPMNYARLGLVPWRPWARTYADITAIRNIATAGNGYYAQPLVGDIEFEDNGSLTIAFIDRTSIQVGPANRTPVSGSATNVVSDFRSSGGMVKWCLVGAGYVLEGTAATCPSTVGLAGNGPGPTGRSFYYELAGDGTGIATLGALAHQPGANQFIFTAADPHNGVVAAENDSYYTQGLDWAIPSTGARFPQFYRVDATNSPASPTNNPPTQGNGQYFGKSNGMGDVELISDPAPIEIGNRVWWDPNLNGSQDPGEKGIPNATMTLWLITDGTTFADGQALPASATLVATTTTNATGSYYFSFEGDATKDNANGYNDQQWSGVTTNFVITGYKTVTQNVAIGTSGIVTTSGNIVQNKVLPNVAYQVRMVGATTPGSANYIAIDAVDTGSAGFILSPKANAGSYGLDTNAYDNPGNAAAFAPIGGVGQNEHAYDFGFGPTVLFDLGNYVWFDTNNNGITDTIEVGAGGVTVILQTVTGTITTTTNSSGYYSFTNLPAGTYTPSIAAANFATGSALANYLSSNGASSNYAAAGNGLDHGIDPANTAAYLSNGVSAAPVTLGTGLQPTGEDPGAPSTPNGDASNTLSADFGFYRLQVGNLVWSDTNNNGIYESGLGETGISGVSVALVNSSGAVVSTTATDSSGLYTFTGMIAGTYVISVTPPTGYASSTGQTATDGSDNTDHGAPSGAGANSAVTSQSFALTPGGGAGTNETASNATGTTVNTNLDFGFVVLNVFFDLGNYVWLDTNNNGITDTGELGVSGVTVTLQTVTGTLTTRTNANGYYSFTNLNAGTYTPTIAAANFATGGPLANYLSSSGARSSYGATDNGRDHGIDPANAAAYLANGVSGAPVTLGSGLQPTGEDGGAPTTPNGDANNNLSADFGFYPTPPNLQINKQVSPAGAARRGDALTYTIVLSNTGGATSNVLVLDLLPTQVTYLSHLVSTGSYVPGTGLWSLPLVPAGSYTLTISVRVN